MIHLVGDIHQPLHVGRAEDRGGNDIRVNFFDKKSNLHSVWDSDMINNYRISYTEFSNYLININENNESTEDENSGLIFRVQIISSTKNLPSSSSRFKNQKDIHKYFQSGWYK